MIWFIINSSKRNRKMYIVYITIILHHIESRLWQNLDWQPSKYRIHLISAVCIQLRIENKIYGRTFILRWSWSYWWVYHADSCCCLHCCFFYLFFHVKLRCGWIPKYLTFAFQVMGVPLSLHGSLFLIYLMANARGVPAVDFDPPFLRRLLDFIL